MNHAELQENFNKSEIVGMYAFYDTKSERYDTPFFCQNDLFAQRHYKMVTDRSETMLNTFQGDFDLNRLGFVNVLDGSYTEAFGAVVCGQTYKKNQEATKS